jgi:hypothetical protein
MQENVKPIALTTEDVCAFVLREHFLPIPHIKLLAHIYMSIVTVNSDNERVFSLLKRIKTISRSNMTDELTCKLGRICFNGKDELSAEEVNAILSLWMTKKNRKFRSGGVRKEVVFEALEIKNNIFVSAERLLSGEILEKEEEEEEADIEKEEEEEETDIDGGGEEEEENGIFEEDNLVEINSRINVENMLKEDEEEDV